MVGEKSLQLIGVVCVRLYGAGRPGFAGTGNGSVIGVC